MGKLDLLPNIDELKPIPGNNTFSECGFNKPFAELEFEEKLKVVSDIIKQTILINTKPNPNQELELLEGNCHTAARVAKQYLEELNIGKNIRYVFVRKEKYDPEDITTKHALLLIDDKYGNTYEFDPSPFIGFNPVKKFNKNNPTYAEYTEINGELLQLLDQLRGFIYLASNKFVAQKELLNYELLFDYSKKYPILNNYLSDCYFQLSLFSESDYDKKRFITESIKLNPYRRINKEMFNKLKEIRLKEIERLKYELNELLIDNKDYKKQLQLSQKICSELFYLEEKQPRMLLWNHKNYPVSMLNSRFFYENNLNIIMIKPSAYWLGAAASIQEKFLKRGNGIVDSYIQNLSQPTELLKLRPMIFSHPLGEEYIRSMSGNAKIILLKEDVEILYKKKNEIRNSLGSKIKNKEVIWYDGEPIKWEPHVTNLVHSTDNAPESALHYSIGNPEYSNMTRFTYPNPKIEKKLVKRKV